MNSIDFSPLYRNSIGFDRMASLFNNALETGPAVDGYPAYNIEAVDENQYRITLAVAGLDQSQIEIKIENGLLEVKARVPSEEDKNYLYRGIDHRGFECRFGLAEHVEVTDARLANGLLTIYLKKEIPEALKPKTIPINAGDNVVEHKPAKSSGKQKGAA